MKKVFFITMFFCFGENSYASDEFVIKFYSKNIEVCEGPEEDAKCYTKKRSSLPNPKESKIEILEKTEQGMVKLRLEKEVVYMHITEFKSNKISKVKSICNKRVFESTESTNSYATHGLVGECNEK